MDAFWAYLHAVVANFTEMANRTSWFYLLSATAGALISYFLYVKEPFSLKRFAAYALPKESLTHASAKMDYFLFILRPIWWGIIFFPFIISIDAYANWTASGLGELFGVQAAVTLGAWHKTIYTVVFLLAFDFGQFYSHYLSHRYWFFWEFHKVHHSAEVMNPLTALRFHPVDDLMGILVIGFFAGVAKGFFQWYWGTAPIIWQIAGVDIGLFLFYFAAYNLRHSHVWLAYPYWLSHIVQSPCQHQIHHSVARQHWDKNIGFIFSIWDWMFGTLYVPKEKESLKYGLGGGQDAPFQSPKMVYWLPFKNVLEQLQSGKPAPEMALVKDRRIRKEQKLAARKQPDSQKGEQA